jgi:hypothetical protein
MTSPDLASPIDRMRRGESGAGAAKTATSTWIWARSAESLIVPWPTSAGSSPSSLAPARVAKVRQIASKCGPATWALNVCWAAVQTASASPSSSSGQRRRITAS